MDGEAQKLNMPELQQQVGDLLRQASSLMDRANTTLSFDETGSKYAEFHQEVTQAAVNVEDLELRMAIVAPMKAGKSTIINGIIGQDILPSRNAAMTTIPTEIIFEAERTEPVLILSDQIRQVFRETLLSLQQKMRDFGLESVQEKISAQYPHLAKLPAKIQALAKVSISEQVAGCKRINNTLTALNDIIRLCSVLDPMADPLRSLVDVPRIYTPFWKAQTSTPTNLLGKLVIVDTPGPNEAGENLALGNVVAEQLRAASAVLIVLNFTSLNTKAEAEVKEDVKRVIELRGQENLYVLVNKVDQRKHGDMTPEQVRQFVAAEFGIGDAPKSDRVFEISARWAFSATSFLVELQQQKDVKLQQMQSARSLAQDLFPLDWEEELEEMTAEELQRKAEKLWKKSGFAPFLEKAIASLMAEAAPRSLLSSLRLSRSRLVELREDIQLRSRAINEDGEKLLLEVEALEADLHSIEECRDRLQEIEQIKTNLYHELNKILEEVKKEAKVSVETYFTESEDQRADLLKKGSIKANQFLNWVSNKFKSPLDLKRQATLEFDTLSEAEEFADLAVAYAKKRADVLLEGIRENTRKQIDAARQGMIDFLDEQTKPIVERARERLNENFHLTLSLPSPRLEFEEIDFNKPRVLRHTRSVDQGYDEVVRTKRSFAHFLWLVPFEVKEQIRRPNRRENFYTVSLHGIVYEVNKLIEQNINNLKQDINQYLDEDFQQRIDIFFNDLDRYLSNYRNSLRQAQADQKLSIEGKEKLKKALNSLIPQVNEQIAQANSYLESTEELMAKLSG